MWPPAARFPKHPRNRSDYQWRVIAVTLPQSRARTLTSADTTTACACLLNTRAYGRALRQRGGPAASHQLRCIESGNTDMHVPSPSGCRRRARSRRPARVTVAGSGDRARGLTRSPRSRTLGGRSRIRTWVAFATDIQNAPEPPMTRHFSSPQARGHEQDADRRRPVALGHGWTPPAGRSRCAAMCRGRSDPVQPRLS
jgi:hypothetical protein